MLAITQASSSIEVRQSMLFHAMYELRVGGASPSSKIPICGKSLAKVCFVESHISLCSNWYTAGIYTT